MNYAPRNTFHASRWIAVSIFLAALALYIRTACPTLGGAFDSEEFQHVAHNLDIAHATGYPLYLFIGKIFTTLVPIGNIAYRMNLLSALIGAVTVVIVYLNALTLTRQTITSVATAAIFATNTAVWRQAGVASVGPLHLLLLATIVYAMLLWHEKQRTDTRPAPTIVAFMFGLGLAHHRTTLWLALPIAILVLLDDPGILRRPRDLAKCFFWLTLPLLLYLYIPIFGNNSPWYANTWQGFLGQISGGDAGAFIRATPEQIAEGITLVSQYLNESFGYIGTLLIFIGAIGAFRSSPLAPRLSLFLGIATIIYSVWGTLYAGEPDRYLVLPFAFLIYWFAIGAGTVEDFLAKRLVTPALAAGASVANAAKQSPKSGLGIAWTNYVRRKRTLAMTIPKIVFAIILALLVVFPFANRFRIADWSTFDRVYKQWDEIFTLPIPQNATLVGNWGQLNAMRYMQRVEHRRLDLFFIGTLYDPEPQTQAALNAFADNRTLFLAPGIAQPIGDYRYAQLGPLLQVRDSPQLNAPASDTARNIAINSSLTLADFSVTTALEPFAPTQSIAPNRTARVSLTWRADNMLNDFLVRIRLIDPDGRAVAQKDETPVRGLYPVSQWQRGEFVADVHNILIPAGSPPGKYTLKMQTLDADSKMPIGDEIALVSFNIERATNLTRDQVFIQHPVDIWMTPNIVLWGYGGSDGAYRAGDKVSLNLVWYNHSENIVEYMPPFTLYICAPSCRLIHRWQWQDIITFYPTKEWRKGEVLKAYYALQLPDNLSPGEYSLGIVYYIGTSDPLIIAKIQIVP